MPAPASVSQEPSVTSTRATRESRSMKATPLATPVRYEQPSSRSMRSIRCFKALRTCASVMPILTGPIPVNVSRCASRSWPSSLIASVTTGQINNDLRSIIVAMLTHAAASQQLTTDGCFRTQGINVDTHLAENTSPASGHSNALPPRCAQFALE